jgi:hypothetical protein
MKKIALMAVIRRAIVGRQRVSHDLPHTCRVGAPVASSASASGDLEPEAGDAGAVGDDGAEHGQPLPADRRA